MLGCTARATAQFTPINNGSKDVIGDLTQPLSALLVVVFNYFIDLRNLIKVRDLISLL